SATVTRAQLLDFTLTLPFYDCPGDATSMAWAPDGSNRLFVALQSGEIVSLRKLGRTPQEQERATFARLKPVYTYGESGVVGLAFDPDFQTNHFVYVMVTVSAHEQQIIRYTDQAGVGTDKHIIVSALPTSGERHNGGALGVGHDGKLYWGVGDNETARGVNADLASMASKIGRANLDGTVPNDNPFFDGAGPNADYIWARGVRNPFKLAFEPQTGNLWLNVVGEKYEQVFVLHGGEHAGYIAYENDQPEGYLAPIVKYRTNGVDSRALTPNGAVRSAGVLSVTTTVPHGFRRGEKITLAGITDASFNGDVYVASTPSATTFTASQAALDAASGNGTAATQAIGGCLVGGTFYDATQFPAEYFDNYFFADWNSGDITRVVLSAPEIVARVDPWYRNWSGYLVDLNVGPDGALYSLIGGQIVRAAYNATSQAIVVSNRHLWLSQGAARSYSVSLAIAPTEDITIFAMRSAGSSAIDVEPESLTFTPTNWDLPQPFTVRAASDAESQTVTATIDVASSGFATQAVVVRARGPEANSFVTSTNIVSVSEGQSGTFEVALRVAPDADVTVQVSVAVGAGHVHLSSGSSLTFTPANYAVPQIVGVQTDDDALARDDVAIVTLDAAGLAQRAVRVRVVDNDPSPPVIDTLPVRFGGLNIAYSYAAHASGVPAPTFQLSAAPAGMTIDQTSGLVQWTPTQKGLFTVTLVTSNGQIPDATQTSDVRVGSSPSCWITPVGSQGYVSGVTANLQGNGFRADDSDVPNAQAEFFIDGVHAYTGEGPGGIFYYGGCEYCWDTMALANACHDILLRVTNMVGETCEWGSTIAVYNPENGEFPGGGSPDCSALDAGATPMDSGLDAGPADAGLPPMDGAVDASVDAAVADAGASDGGPNSSGAGGSTDSGGSASAGGSAGAPTSDSGDASIADAGAVQGLEAGTDASDPSGGQIAPPRDSGCDCRVSRAHPSAPRPGAMVVALATIGLAFARTQRRRTRRAQRVTHVCAATFTKALATAPVAQLVVDFSALTSRLSNGGAGFEAAPST
ncbi:MAG TPA: PQQ-dependent sugar dehydrogenase, partial [Polyangiales bacterium]|nr:PQQ-dependent sugar dehydrogenase [Polyangiales bacterium]